MANIGSFTAQNNGFAGTVRTLNLNVKVKIVPNDKGSENAPDYRILAPGGNDIGAACKKLSQMTERPYLSVSLDDPSFPATIYARLVEDEDAPGTHNLIWTRQRAQA
ncbi:DUF736 domain-containing protein [Lysobacter enzymogenes]|uniref:DUF736 domain-containing protein n=1 Tax=Lysobacter enzymogenes TaxID=69 RepID=A0A3N2RKB3_LYSEN|nr:DUF736 domain-containing protein [Lysobacter enzymogenes]ROU07883.1 DUF736 domain-containing protein [Lysobacter enzymogenes]